MGILLERYGKLQEKLMYKDKCTISRVDKDIKKGPFDDKTKRTPVETLTDIPCKISYSRADTPGSTNGSFNISERIVTIFLPIRYKILEGDWLVAVRTFEDKSTDTVMGLTNLPDIYDTHQQVLIKESSDA